MCSVYSDESRNACHLFPFPTQNSPSSVSVRVPASNLVMGPPLGSVQLRYSFKTIPEGSAYNAERCCKRA
jgi:hypothetical protein